MTAARSLCLTAALLALMLAGCVPVTGPSDGSRRLLAEAPKPLDDQGIGGTGAPAARPPQPPAPFDDEGVGGTGIIGVVTGFGSIIVNGRHIRYDETTPVRDPFGAVRAADLRIGHVVAVEAQGPDDALTARSIALRQPAVGPIDAVDAPGGRVRVLGQWVAIDDATRFADRTASDGLAVGDAVAVSGLRRSDGVIVATRIDPRPQTAQAALTAPVTRIDGTRVFLGDIMVPRRLIGQSGTLAPGDTVSVVGPLRQGRLLPQRARLRPRTPFGGRFRRLSIQGFPTPTRDGFRLRGLRVVGKRASGGPVVIDGEFDRAGLFRARRVRILAPRKLRRDAIERGLRRAPRATGNIRARPGRRIDKNPKIRKPRLDRPPRRRPDLRREQRPRIKRRLSRPRAAPRRPARRPRRRR